MLFTTALLAAQEVADVPKTQPDPSGPTATVRGVVVNAATGQPIPRVLVKTVGSDGVGTLTNGEGRFEIRDVPSGVQNFDLIKPGFQGQPIVEDGEGFVPRVARVADGMPELSFSLAPKNAIFGHVTLSTGRPAVGIGLILLRRAIVDGRTSWEEVERHQTTPDGAFRYAGLSDGTYLLLSQPEFDNDSPAEPSCNADAPAEMTGYAPVFERDATDLASADRIVVAGGQTAEANLSLNLRKFYLVQVAVAHMPTGENWTLSHTLFDHGGAQVEYRIHKEKDNSLCVYLPDGSYTLAVQASMEEGESPRVGAAPPNEASAKDLTGLTTFTVDGNAVRNLRVPLTQSASTSISLRYEPAPPQSVKEKKSNTGQLEEEPDASPLVLSVTRANAVTQNEAMRAQAIQIGETSYALQTTLPGAYWIHASVGRAGICLGSVSAGGQDLARSPWTAPLSGAGIPIDVVLRTDCPSLTVQMPPTLAAESPGESTTLYIYAVPEFDSIGAISRGQLDQFSNRSTTLNDLSPGSYRVFAFRTPHLTELLNPGAFDALGSGQRVTLEPHGSVTVVVKEISK